MSDDFQRTKAMLQRAEAEERRLRCLELAVECAAHFNLDEETEIINVARGFYEFVTEQDRTSQ